MLAIPAVDLREGACVQLVGGSYARERVRRPDPVGAAREWAGYGFRRLHVVDLDAATGRGSNRAVVRDIVRGSQVPVQAGGGVRELAAVEELLREGVRAVVVGTRALEEPEWLAAVAGAHPGAVIVAADVRERQVVTRGWRRTLPLGVLEAVRELNALPLAGVLVTAVHREGRMAGTDLALMAEVVEASSAPVLASGGVGSMADLRALERRGVSAVVLGMALYTGALDPCAVAEEFGKWGDHG